MDNKEIRQLIAKYDKKQLEDMIIYILGRSQLAEEAFLEYCKEKETDTKTDNYNIIIEKQIKQHWANAKKIIEEFDMYGGGSETDEDDAYYELKRMEELFKENNMLWTLRKSILDEMLEFVKSDNSGFTDDLMDIAVTLCEQKEENLYLADFLNKYSNSYYQRLAGKIFLDNGEEEKFLKNKIANLEYASDYLELAQYYCQHGDEEKALKIVYAGLDKCVGRLDEIYEYLFKYYKNRNDEYSLEKLFKDSERKKRNQERITELMYQYYEEKGNYEKEKETLLKLLKCINDEKVGEIYVKCKEKLKIEDFQEKEKEILSIIKRRNLTIYFDILLEKGQSEEVMKYVIQHQQYQGWGIDAGHYFTKRLVVQYPREVVELYWKEVAFYVGMGKEKNYRYAVIILKDIQKIMKNNKWSDEWNMRYKEFLEEHKRKKLLLKELNKFNF